MRKPFVLILSIFILSACTNTNEPNEVQRKSIDELAIELEGSNANSFLDDVSTAYSLFPIAFADSDGDKYGDLKGIIEKLDYLNDGNSETKTDLGIDAVWFNPIYPSNTYHKYDIKDYKAIDPKFGTLDDFKMLVEEAHKRGIKIILDMVFNHTSSEHPWFLKALQKEEPYFSYYNIQTKVDFTQYPGKTGWNLKNGLTYYSGFWSEMPELNMENEAVRNELKSVLDFWLDLGVDGFRYDAAKHVYDTNEYPSGTQLLLLNKQFWMEMKAYVKEKNPNAYLVGEVWLASNDAAPYASGFDSLFNFDIQGWIVSTVKNEYQDNFVSKFNQSVQKYTAKNPEFINAIFLSNHDQDRVLSQFSGSENKMRLAAHLLFSLPGLPFVYYGEELGMTGKKPDEKIREPFVWDGTTNSPNAMWEGWVYNADLEPYTVQVKDPNSMWSMYRDLIEIRKEHPVLRDGTLEALDLGSNRLLGYIRSDDNEKIAIISNLGPKTETIELSFNAIVLRNNKENTLEQSTLTLQPYGSVYLVIK